MAESLLHDLLPSWRIALLAQNKSPRTLTSYTDSVKAYLRWCETTGTTPELTKANVQAFTASLLAAGAEPATAKIRHAAVCRYAAWLADEGEIDNNPLIGLKPPKLDKKVTDALTDDEVKSLISACRGKDFLERRDEAIVRLMAETGIRAGELVGMLTSDVDINRGVVIVRRGKGGKGRVVPFGPQTTQALDRYIRARRIHRLADTADLWLGGGGQTFGYHGLALGLKKRAQMAGVKGFHVHRFRHTAATRWLRAGGTEGGLMAIAGWSTRDMLDRYCGASAGERAAAEARRLNLGEW